MYYLDGYPRDNGATDMMDSSRLAGVLSVFKFPGFFISYYFIDNKVVRCRVSEVLSDQCADHKNFSRDQLVPLIAGYYYAFPSTGYYANLVYENIRFIFCPNWDILSPSQLNHVRVCAGKKPNWFGLKWLELDIWYNAKYSPLAEPNQLLCMLMVAGPKYVQKWKQSNPQWEKAIRTYWEGFRDEKEVSDHVVGVVSKI